ncbi:aspartic peptidase domain-containing protein [Mycena galopus ATCC 62051]|nr:aspartic peptidase domain-containing protein [Mycena galopus ATCC 62051]
MFVYRMQMLYAAFHLSGKEYTDNLVLGGLTVTKQSIRDGAKSSGFTENHRFGPIDLTEDTVSGSTTVPTTVNNLFTQGTISTQVLGVSFSPESIPTMTMASCRRNRFDQIHRLSSALPAARPTPTGLASWTKLPTENLAFTIGGVSYSLTPAQYTIPTAQYNYWGLSTGKFYGWIGAGGTDASEGPNFIIGQRFLDYYYSVFDTTNNWVGFATRAV